MALDLPTLTGSHIRLEPLQMHHAEALTLAAAADPSLYQSLYQWTVVPQGIEKMRAYIETALAGRDAGRIRPFATVRLADDAVIGSTRYFDIESFPWPAGHPRHGLTTPDVCEIGYTWLTASAIRTAANTEAKLLMLTHAFESWAMLRVCLHTDARNKRSQAAIERMGGKFEGKLRAHRMGADFAPRESYRYSILACEWPEAKRALAARLRMV